MPADLTKPVANDDPDPHRRVSGVCDVCHVGRLYLVWVVFGVLAGYRLCSECLDKYTAARSAGRVEDPA